jgi:Cdc6-like AAA superfamily ATPase
MPLYASTARFDPDSKRKSCTKDTRTEILQKAYNWFQGVNIKTDETLPMEGNINGHIFWLDGEAGTGKSTIAQTVANHFDETSQLGASFFCSRDNADCSNLNLIFPTIAHQLSSFNPTFKKHVSEAMRKDPDVQSALPSRQLQKLIVEPLHAVLREGRFEPCIIVIDALDECK